MPDDPRFGAATRFLTARGAATLDHPGGTLLDHLTRVRWRLADWDVPVDVQLAGLCHAAYGTDGFDVALVDIDARSVLADVVGEPAEALVYLYGSCDRRATYPAFADDPVVMADRFTGVTSTPAPSALRGFAVITAANELDVVQHNPAMAERHTAALITLMERLRPYLPDAALVAWDLG